MVGNLFSTFITCASKIHVRDQPVETPTPTVETPTRYGGVCEKRGCGPVQYHVCLAPNEEVGPEEEIYEEIFDGIMMSNSPNQHSWNMAVIDMRLSCGTAVAVA